MKKKAIGRPAKMERKTIRMRSTVARRLEAIAKVEGMYQGAVIDRALALFEQRYDV